MTQFTYADYLPEKEDMMTPGAAGFTRFPSDVFAGNRVNDSFAAMGSALRNLGDKTLFAPIGDDGVIVSQQAGTLALQNANDVNLTGGVLSGVRGGCAVGSLILYWGDNAAYAAQYTQLLNMGWVIADGRTVINPYTGASVTAPNFIGRYPLFSSDALFAFGNFFQGTSTAGAHSHGGATGGTVLTDANMPSTVLMDVTVSGSGGSLGGGSNALNRVRNGTNTAHAHTIPIDGDHTHVVEVRPPTIQLIPLARIF